MHELSMAHAVVTTVSDAVDDERVLTVRLRVGKLAGLVPEAMHFAWDLACAGTRLEGARLEIEELPVTVDCLGCGGSSALPEPLPMRCPACDSRQVLLRGGQELEVGSVEVADDGDGAGDGGGDRDESRDGDEGRDRNGDRARVPSSEPATSGRPEVPEAAA